MSPSAEREVCFDGLLPGGPDASSERAARHLRLAMLQCGHLFHHSCIGQWMADDIDPSRCPTCREPHGTKSLALVAEPARPVERATDRQPGLGEDDDDNDDDEQQLSRDIDALVEKTRQNAVGIGSTFEQLEAWHRQRQQPGGAGPVYSKNDVEYALAILCGQEATAQQTNCLAEDMDTYHAAVRSALRQLGQAARDTAQRADMQFARNRALGGDLERLALRSEMEERRLAPSPGTPGSVRSLPASAKKSARARQSDSPAAGVDDAVYREIAAVEAQIDEQQKRIDMLDRELADTERAMEEKSTKVRDLETRLAQYCPNGRTVDHTTGIHVPPAQQQLEEEHARLVKELEQHNGVVAVFENMLADLDAQISRMDSKLCDTNERIAEYEKTLGIE